MKKIHILLAATCAMTFAACSQSDDLMQDNTLTTAQEDLPVAFDTYVANNSTATTRSTYSGTGLFETANLEGTYNATPASRTGGFGIYAYTHTGNTIGNTDKPDFMLNQQVVKNGDDGWVYDPVKYWPNMTKNPSTAYTDAWTGNKSEATECDYVSFFAYAPYQQPLLSGNAGWNKSDGKIYFDDGGTKTPKTVGITSLPIESSTDYPKIHYVMNPTAAQSQDLLFGVAPAGGISYRAVNGELIHVDQGMALQKMLKPATHTQMKFLFLHALTALKMNIAAAIDEVAPGSNALDTNTKVYVNSITITPVAASPTTWSIATEGDLDLHPTKAGIPNWIDDTGETNPTMIKAASLKIGKSGETGVNVIINNQLQKDSDTPTTPGVTNKKRDVFTDHTPAPIGEYASADDTTFDPLMFIPVYTGIFNRQVDVTIDYDVVTTDAAISGGKVTTNNVVTKRVLLKSFKAGRIYNLSIVLGLTSVKVDAEGEDWGEEEKVIDLPRNLD